MIVWTLVYLAFPALVLVLCQRFAPLNKLGAVVLCYGAGLLLGNLCALPPAAREAQSLLLTAAVPLALPLILFTLDVRGWSRLAPTALLAFFLETMAVLIAATAAYPLFRHALGPEGWKAVGMLIGCYTGGTFNLNAIGLGLRTTQSYLSAVNLADMLVCPLYLLLAMTIMRRMLLFILPPFRSAGGERVLAEAAAARDFGDYRGFLSRRGLPALGAALGLALLVCAAGAGAAMLLPGKYFETAAIIAISTLGIACSFFPAVRRLTRSFQLGQYFFLVFTFAISSSAELGKLLGAAPGLLGLVGFMVFVSAVLHALLAAAFRIDADTMIITSIAGIFSPPFVPMVASALRNREIIMTGVVTGIIGWVIGTYLGIGYAYVLRAIF